jgi:hypothetical protein
MATLYEPIAVTTERKLTEKPVKNTTREIMCSRMSVASGQEGR